MAGRECQGYFYKRLQRYQQCGAGAEIPIFADDIPLTRVPANESECQQAQEGRRKQRQMVIKQVFQTWGDTEVGPTSLSQPAQLAGQLGAGLVWREKVPRARSPAQTERIKG